MQRWHTPTCSAPDIEISGPNGRIPRCRACGESCQVAGLAMKSITTAGGTTLEIPPDKPKGQMDLWWPLYLPYTRELWGASDYLSLRNQDEHDANVVASSATSPIYRHTLKPTEFRLVCLEATSDHDYPVHLTLEEYDFYDCPEYETVSYTWAGEDGDGSFCKPIYVGPFWDVLLQTKNCWEMLRFVRPWRGKRMLWVDAICINQADIFERNTQVANMNRIYSACERVIVYLGPDVALPLRERQHARRAPLHELARPRGWDLVDHPALKDAAELVSPGQTALMSILRHKYFSRVWVIQELLLSRRVIIRIGNGDFWADIATPATVVEAAPEWQWEETPAAWLKYLSKGASASMDLPDLLCLTAFSKSTDPRDRLYGLLGINPDFADGREGLKVDYSLSCQHIFIGLFAYCLVVGRLTTIFYLAPIFRPAAGKEAFWPTWAPDWRSGDTWARLLKSPSIQKPTLYRRLLAVIKNSTLTQFTPSSAREPATSFNLHELEGPEKGITEALGGTWETNLQIDSDTGALRINLIHLMSFSKPLERVGRLREYRIFAMRKGIYSVFVLSALALDRLVKPSSGDRLCLLHDDKQSPTYLVLRPSPPSSSSSPSSLSGSFQLLAACPAVVIQTPTTRTEVESPGLQKLPLGSLNRSLYDTLQVLRRKLDESILPNDEVQRKLVLSFFPGVQITRDLLDLLVVLHPPDGTSEDRNAFAQAYLKCVTQHSPIIQQGYVHITIWSHWAIVRDLYFPKVDWLDRHMNDQDHPWEYFDADTNKWISTMTPSSTYRKIISQKAVEQVINVRFPLAAARACFDARGPFGQDLKTINALMDRLAYTSKTSGESLWSMMTRPAVEEDRLTACPRGGYLEPPHTILEMHRELGIVGSTSLVTIE